jgi:UDP-N-acetylmuramyl pentapeptide phosphotransferase/UDP-N-acetylglucosamine-1-phosphate transferase
MIYHLLWHLRNVVTHRLGFYAYQDVMFRCVAAVLTSFCIAILLGPVIIRWLMRKKIGDRPEFHHAKLNELTKEKANTPTMGGLIIILAGLATTLLWAKLNNPFVQKAIVLVIWFGALGGVDDWLKLTSDFRHRSRNGLKPWETRTSPITWASYLLLPAIPAAGELSIFYSAIVGAVLGFLWYNCHPAQVFMGDVGSLPLGAAMGYGALVTRNEILLLIIGGVFIVELISVVLQIGYFKYTGGKRLFRCAPLHHHFHLAGWSEPQVVVRFWLLAAAFAAVALATLKIR